MIHAERRRGRPRSRILYWFRTPPGVRIGRSALDEDAIRLIEESNPGIEFDWTRILKGQDVPPEPKPPAVQERRAQPRPRVTPQAAPVPAAPAMPAAEPLIDVGCEMPTIEDIQEVGAPPPDANTTRPSDADLAAHVSAPAAPSTAAGARLGSEGLSRLRARHAEVLARISEKIGDLARREELKAEAERLNPDTWVTDAEVTAGLEAYESVFESLRGVVGRRRKRRRNRSGSGASAQPADASAAAPAVDDDGGNEPAGDL